VARIVRWLLIAYNTDTASAEGAATWRALSAHTERLVPLLYLVENTP
jgi:hypothetical protein